MNMSTYQYWTPCIFFIKPPSEASGLFYFFTWFVKQSIGARNVQKTKQKNLASLRGFNNNYIT